MVKTTPNGTKYLTESEIYLAGEPIIKEFNLLWALDNLNPEFNIPEDYSFDCESHGENIAKFAGQLCYLSFGPNRTTDPDKYFKRILESGHGSILEHINFSFLITGIDRTVTHELVRHRAGWAFSQVSQRYVDTKGLRFVEPLEFQNNKFLHDAFIHDIDRAVKEYLHVGDVLEHGVQHEWKAPLITKTERRKQLNQVARCILPNYTEAPIFCTANVRALRHFLEMRSSPHADNKISQMAFKLGEKLKYTFPHVFQDFEPYEATDSFGNTLKFWKNIYKKV